MAVHWGERQRTIKHTRAFCQCPDGRSCATSAKPPKRKLKERGNLEARRKDYDNSKQGAHRTRPGSNSK